MSINLKTSLATAALASLLMACTPAENANAPSAEPAAGAEAASMSAHEASKMGAGMMGPETPYSASEKTMHEAMMKAHGADPQETYALKMIEHHRGAITMSEVLMQQSPDPELRQMAEKVITMQRQEITELEQWVTKHRAGSTATAPGAQPTG